MSCGSLPASITHLLLINAAILFVYMSLWFIVARVRKRLDTVDIAWGLGFVVSAWAVVLQTPSHRTWTVAVLVTIWGARLAQHIFRRAKRSKEDPRYKEISAKWKGNYWLRAYLSIFLLQGFLIWVVSIPIIVVAGRVLPGQEWMTGVGACIWLVGFIVESIADHQLASFLQFKDRPKVLETGLWRYSRHPNYFGELVQWWGIAVIALQVSYGWIGMIGPFVLSILIIFVSGVPPIEKRRLKDKAYQDYSKRTSVLIPLPQKKV